METNEETYTGGCTSMTNANMHNSRKKKGLLQKHFLIRWN